LLGDGVLDDVGRIDRAYYRVLGRPAEEKEIKAALEYIRHFPGPDGQAGRLPAWTSFCRALVASNDFLYIR
jgi:hypothetical protein